MEWLRLWSGSPLSESCCIFPSAAEGQGLFVKLESLGKGEMRLCSIYCKSSTGTANRHYCYKWWWTWLNLPLIRMPAVQRRLKAAPSSIALILSQTLHRNARAVLEPALCARKREIKGKSAVSIQLLLQPAVLLVPVKHQVIQNFQVGEQSAERSFFYLSHLWGSACPGCGVSA